MSTETPWTTVTPEDSAEQHRAEHGGLFIRDRGDRFELVDGVVLADANPETARRTGDDYQIEQYIIPKDQLPEHMVESAANHTSGYGDLIDQLVEYYTNIHDVASEIITGSNYWDLLGEFDITTDVMDRDASEYITYDNTMVDMDKVKWSKPESPYFEGGFVGNMGPDWEADHADVSTARSKLADALMELRDTGEQFNFQGYVYDTDGNRAHIGVDAGIYVPREEYLMGSADMNTMDSPHIRPLCSVLRETDAMYEATGIISGAVDTVLGRGASGEPDVTCPSGDVVVSGFVPIVVHPDGVLDIDPGEFADEVKAAAEERYEYEMDGESEPLTEREIDDVAKDAVYEALREHNIDSDMISDDDREALIDIATDTLWDLAR